MNKAHPIAGSLVRSRARARVCSEALRAVRASVRQRAGRSLETLARVLGTCVAGSIAACALGPQDNTIDTVFDPCSPIVVVPQADSAPEEKAAVQAGLSMWNVLAGTRLTLDETPGAAHLPVVFEDAATPIYGFYDDEAGVVYVNNGLRGREREVLIAHELGHALGLVHVDAGLRASVMNNGNLEVEPNAADAAVLAEMWGRCR